MSAPESDKYRIELGPLFTAGLVFLVYGLLRRRPLAAAAGLAAIVLDQRSELGRSLKEKARAKYMTVQYVGDDRDEAGEAKLDVEDDRDRAVVDELDRHAGAEESRRDADT